MNKNLKDDIFDGTKEILSSEINLVNDNYLEIDEIRSKKLKLGDQGEEVIELQKKLWISNYLKGALDGIFDMETEDAVRSFQTDANIPVDGTMDSNTMDEVLYFSKIPGEPFSNIKGVVVDAGHGGNDPGAVGKEIIEKEYTLKISQYMANRFRELGIPFAMTRNSDEYITRDERVKRMKAPFGDVSNAIVVSNHINAGGGEC